MKRSSIKIENGVARNPLIRLNEPVNLCFGADEQIAIVGENGSGKSLLTDMITGKTPLLNGKTLYDFYPSESKLAYENIKYISFRDSYGAADANYYYQQRWNNQDQEDVPVVADMLDNIKCDPYFRETLYNILNIPPLLNEKLILLSSGELRRFQLVKTLLTNPRILIVDNPYIGLDVKTRELLSDLFKKLIASYPVQIIVVISSLDEIPDFVTHVLKVENMCCGEKVTKEAYMSSFRKDENKGLLSSDIKEAILSLPEKEDSPVSEEVVRLNGVSIRYGSRTILKELDWMIRKGEKWALGGENGAGKSTLLSLICADNPQSYACDISLFGNKRGSGESIWSIKKHIGYVSPEMHRSYLQNVPTSDIVASGLHDSIGLYKKADASQKEICRFWLSVFGMEKYENTPFLQLSSGEQRLVLLARAFVKDQSLLILDEPLHGLDTYNRRLVKSVIECFCRRKDKTVIMVTHYKEEIPGVISGSLFLKKNR